MWGVINVRGAVVPVAELRFAFGIAEESRTEASKMLVVEVDLAGEPLVVAVAADAVLEVSELDRAAMEPLPPKGSSWPQSFVQASSAPGRVFSCCRTSRTSSPLRHLRPVWPSPDVDRTTGPLVMTAPDIPARPDRRRLSSRPVRRSFDY